MSSTYWPEVIYSAGNLAPVLTRLMKHGAALNLAESGLLHLSAGRMDPAQYEAFKAEHLTPNADALRKALRAARDQEEDDLHSLRTNSQRRPREALFAEAQRVAEQARLEAKWDLIERSEPSTDPNMWTCPDCGENVLAPNCPGELYNCQCTLAAEAEARAEYIAAHKAEAAARLWRGIKIPTRFAACSFDNFNPRPGTAEALEACRTYAAGFRLGETVKGLLLAGGYGSGKTHLALGAGRAIVENALAEVHFTTVGALLNRLKAGDFDWSIVEQAKAAELLVLDDLAQDVPSGWDRGVLFDLINYRYEELRPTIFTTNCGAKQLADVLGGALVSRLYEMAELVEVKATDFRKTG